MQPDLDDHVTAVRRFTRFYTRRIGVLQEGLLGSSLTLTEARIVYEIATRARTTATDLREELDLDAGYLSRTLKGLEAREVVNRAVDPSDQRQSVLTLTAGGDKLFAEVDAASKREVGAVLGRLATPDQASLVAAMATIERLFQQSEHPKRSAIVLRPHRPGDMGWVISRHGSLYAREYGWDITFEALVAKIAGEFIETFDGKSDCCFIAERGGENVGASFVVRKDATTAKLRMVIVDPSARGLGVGRQLVEACMQFARDAGYTRMTLWTNDVLVSARRLYQSLGFEMIASEPHHSFGVDLVSETWERDL